MGAGAIQAGRAFVEITGDSSKLREAINGAIKSVGSFGSSVGSNFSSIGDALKGIGSSVGTAAGSIGTIGAALSGIAALAGGELVSLARESAEAGDALDEMSARTGISATRLSGLQLGLKLAGLEMADFEAILRKGQKTLTDAVQGSDSAQQSFARLGFTVADISGLSPEQQFKKLGAAIASIENPAQRAAAAMDVFGKTGTRLIPLLADGGAGFERLAKRAEELNLVITPDQIQRDVQLADAFDEIALSAARLRQAIGGGLSSLLVGVFDGLSKATGQAIKFANENPEIVQRIALTAAGIGALGIGALGAAAGLGVLSYGFTQLGAAVGFAGTVISASLSPLGLVGAAIGGVGLYAAYSSGLLADWGETAGEAFRNVYNVGTETLDGIAAALASGNFQQAASIGFQGIVVEMELAKVELLRIFYSIQDAWGAVVAAIRNAWEFTIGRIVESINTVGYAFQTIVDTVTGALASALGADDATIADELNRQAEKRARAFLEYQKLADDESRAQYQQIKADQDAGITARQKALDEARATLSSMRSELTRTVEGAKQDAKNKPAVPDFPRAPDRPELEQLRQATTLKSAGGSFSGAALFGISGQTNTSLGIMRDQRALQEKTVEELKGLRRDLTGALVFGP